MHPESHLPHTKPVATTRTVTPGKDAQRTAATATASHRPALSRNERILVVTPTPTHPQNAGNRSRIHRLLCELQDLGFEIHVAYTGNECKAQHVAARPDHRAMTDSWDRYIYLPSLLEYVIKLLPVGWGMASSGRKSDHPSAVLFFQLLLARVLLPIARRLIAVGHLIVPRHGRAFDHLTTFRSAFISGRSKIRIATLRAFKRVAPSAHALLRRTYWKLRGGEPLPDEHLSEATQASSFTIDDWYNFGIDRFFAPLMHAINTTSC